MILGHITAESSNKATGNSFIHPHIMDFQQKLKNSVIAMASK